jgi:hypothetical protein
MRRTGSRGQGVGPPAHLEPSCGVCELERQLHDTIALFFERMLDQRFDAATPKCALT